MLPELNAQHPTRVEKENYRQISTKIYFYKSFFIKIFYPCQKTFLGQIDFILFFLEEKKALIDYITYEHVGS
jgi:hypothetical protein